jgi:beta-phosphoglucomutase-like phosphatase (HAD superfamily)
VSEGLGAVIFDFDGTLYDAKHLSLRLIVACPSDIFRIRAERQTRKSFVGCDYRSSDAYYREFFAALESAALCRAARRSPDAMRAWYFDHYMPRMIRILSRYYHSRPFAAGLFAGAKIPIAVYSDYPRTQTGFGQSDLTLSM